MKHDTYTSPAKCKHCTRAHRLYRIETTFADGTTGTCSGLSYQDLRVIVGTWAVQDVKSCTITAEVVQ